MRFLILFVFLFSNDSFADDWLYGTWEITGAEFSVITTWSDAEAEAFIGKSIEYSRKKLEFNNKKCNQYTMETKVITKNTYEDKNGFTFS